MSELLKLNDVVAAERRKILERRREAGLSADGSQLSDVCSEGSPSENKKPVEGSHGTGGVSSGSIEPSDPGATVGLALSGGGIRSACIGLGILQALYRRGVLRHIDYLSTVSGGGYVGAYLTSFVSTRSDKKIEWNPESKDGDPNKEKLPFYARKGEAQPPDVQTLANRGRSLSRPILFLSRHLWGWGSVNAFVLSGLIALGAILSYLMRSLWLPENQFTIAILGFEHDVSLAFFPATVMLIVWLVSVSASAILQRKNIDLPPIASWAYVGLMATVFMGAVLVLSTGNVEFDENSVNSQTADVMRALFSWLGKAVSIVFVAAILPSLNPKALLRSGAKPERPIYSWVFNIASSALLLGTPLLVFYILSGENISGWNETRTPQYTMSPLTIRDWSKFKMALNRPRVGEKAKSQEEKEAADYNSTPEYAIWSWLGDALGERKLDEKHPLNRIEIQQRKFSQSQSELPFGFKFVQFVGHCLGTDPRFQRRHDELALLSRWQHKVIDEFNKDCLSDPTFYVVFENALKEPSSNGRGNVQPHAAPKNQPTPKDQEGLKDIAVDAAASPPVVLPLSRVDDVSPASREINALQHEIQRERIRRTIAKDLCRECTQLRLNLINELLQLKEEGGWYSKAGLSKGFVARPSEKAEDYQVQKEKYDKYKKTEDEENTKLKAVNDSLREHTLDVVAVLEEKAASVREEIDLKDPSDDDFAANQILLARLEESTFSLQEYLSQVRRLNWNLMQAYFGDKLIYPPTEVFASVVTEHDQAYRANVLQVSLAVFLILGLVFSVNPTLLHSYYRDRLSELWIRHPHPVYGKSIPLEQLKTWPNGGPIPLMGAALSLFGLKRSENLPPLDRYTFTPLSMGAESVGYASPPPSFRCGDCNLADVMAISGAAVSPIAIDNIVVRVLLVLFNFRLGRWITNPRFKRGVFDFPSPLRLLWGAAAVEPPDRMFLFVSDGGHVENTGIAALLARRCRVIIACDSSQDGTYNFVDFQKLLQAEGVNKGCRFTMLGAGERPVDFTELTPAQQTRISARTHLVLRICYSAADGNSEKQGVDAKTAATIERPATEDGYLILLKPGITGREPWGNSGAQNFSSEFPHDITLDQFYSPERFHAYRQLGEQMGDTLCDDLFPSACEASEFRLANWNPPQSSPCETRDSAPQAIAAAGSDVDAKLAVTDVSVPIRNEGDGVDPSSASPAKSLHLDAKSSAEVATALAAIPHEAIDKHSEFAPDTPHEGTAYSADTAESVFQLLRSKSQDDRATACSILMQAQSLDPNDSLRARGIDELIRALKFERVIPDQMCRAIRHLGEGNAKAIAFLKRLANNPKKDKSLRAECRKLVESMRKIPRPKANPK